MTFFKEILSIFFPEKCVFCGKTIGEGLGPCSACKEKLPLVKEPICPLCGCNQKLCTCHHKEYAYVRRISPAYYGEGIKRAVMELKFHRIKGAAVPLAELMAAHVKKYYQGIDFDCIVAVPMTKQKVRQRGYNQAVLLGQELSRITEIPFKEGLLIKSRSNQIQHHLDKEQRWENVKNTYTACSKVKGKKILLVDDISTTGATFDACAQALLKAGAEEIYCVSAAMVV